MSIALSPTARKEAIASIVRFADQELEVLARDVSGRVMGAFVRATKPAKAAACCGSECCA